MMRRALLIMSLCWVAGANAMSAAEFFVRADMLSATLSPDGRHVAAIVGTDEQSLVLVDAQTSERRTLLRVADFTENDAALLATTWLDEQTIAALFSEVRAGVKNLLDTRRNRYILIVRLPQSAASEPEILGVRTSGELVDPLPGVQGAFLYAKGGPTSRVYRINTDLLTPYKSKLSKLSKIDGGQFVRSNEVAKVDGYAVRWFVNDMGDVHSALHLGDGALRLTVFDGDALTRELKIWDAGSIESDEPDAKVLLPIARAPGTDRFYCLDVKADEQREVYLVDYVTKEQSLVYTSSDDDIVDLIVTPGEDRLVGVRVLREGQLRHVYFDADSTDDAPDPSATLRLSIGASVGGEATLEYVEAHSQPGRFMLARDGDVPRYIGGSAPHLENRLRSTLVEERVEVQGLSIPYLLTLPSAASRGAVPLIVMPHGGPIGVFDTRYYDNTTQFLAANGYAVLRVNFRGSGGYSSAFEEAGKREYGGLMLEDIHAATLAVTRRADIAADRVAVFGASYGGYAATMLAVAHPGVYQCAVSVAGLVDIPLFLGRTDWSAREKAWGREYIGDAVNDYGSLNAISAHRAVANLQTPFLVMHGAKDNVVDVEHAYRLKRMLDKHQKDYEWHIFDEGTHVLASVEETVAMHAKVLDFVQRHLGPAAN